MNTTADIFTVEKMTTLGIISTVFTMLYFALLSFIA